MHESRCLYIFIYSCFILYLYQYPFVSKAAVRVVYHEYIVTKSWWKFQLIRRKSNLTLG